MEQSYWWFFSAALLTAAGEFLRRFALENCNKIGDHNLVEICIVCVCAHSV